LQEPLVGRWFWRDFAIAADLADKINRQDEIERLVKDLPPPNQDTLAFVILHLQRIAESPDVKMPVGNLAKVFGPTIVGYSDNDLDANTMLKETKKQQIVLDTLLTIPAEFWRKFVYRSHDEGRIYSSGGTFNKAKARTMQSPYTPQAPTSMSSVDRLRSNGKKIYFSDDSPKEQMKTRGQKQKRTFFD
jgi:Rac GTPase-activating protein 1